MWYLLITVIALCYGFPYNDHHELSCKENIEHAEVGPQGSKSPYALSIEKENTHVLLVTIHSPTDLPFKWFTIKSSSMSNLHSHFTFVDDSGAQHQHCKGGKAEYKRTLHWTTQDEIKEEIKFTASVWYNSTTYWSDITTVFQSKAVLPPNPSCGKNIRCLSNCSADDCDYIVSWLQKDNETVTFKIQTKVTPGTISNSYAAIGLSTNQSMPGSSIIMCLNTNGKMSAELGYTTGHKYSKISDTKGMLQYVSGETNGDIFQCEMKRNIVSTDDMILDLRKNWYLLFAHGNVSNGIPVHHDFRTASNTTVEFIGPFEVKDFIKPDPWCGKAKGCFMNCTDTECDYIISWTHDSQTITYDIQTKVKTGTSFNSWAAIGLSTNQEMDGSSIMMCMSDFGLMRTELGFTTGHTYSKIDDVKYSLTFLNGSTDGNIFRCRMKRDIPSTNEKIFDLRDNWYLLFAHGSLSKGFPQHHEYKTTTMRPMNFLAPLSAQHLTSKQYSPDMIPPDPACGKTKGCLTNCTNTDCQYIVSWTHDQETVTFEIQTKVEPGTIMNSYAAIGLSSNQSMAGSSIMMCLVNNGGKMSAEYGYTTGHTYAQLDDIQHSPALINGSTDGNIFGCTIQRDINLSTDKIFSLRNEWFLLFAQGNVTKGIPQHHTNRTASNSMIDFLASIRVASYETRNDEDVLFTSLYDESVPIEPAQVFRDLMSDSLCSTSKNCFTNCKGAGCSYVVTWLPDGADMVFNITAKVESGTGNLAWIGIGFSSNGKMIGSSFLMCLNIDGHFKGEYGNSLHQYEDYTPLKNFSLPIIESSVDGDVLHCSVRRPITSHNNNIFDLTKPWYLLIAHGPIRNRRGLQIKPTMHTFTDLSNNSVTFLTVQKNKNIPGKINPDSECGLSKSCFHDCNATNCHYLVSWTSDLNDITFNITARVTGVKAYRSWVALGFSPDGAMPNSSFIMCKNGNGTFYGQYGYSSQYTQFIGIDNVTLQISDSSVNGDIVQCTIKRPLISNTDKIFNLTTEWHILFAYGDVTLNPNGKPTANYHKFKIGSTYLTDFQKISNIPTTMAPSTDTTAANSPDKITLDPECGITKGCFPTCSGSSCSSLVTWQKNGNYILFEIAEEIASTTDNRWIAIGFSGNQQMDNTSVIMCQHKNGNVSFDLGYNNGYSFQTLAENMSSKMISNASLTVSGKVMRCTLRRTINSADPEVFDLNNEWFILMANGPITAGYPAHHDVDPKSTSSKENFISITTVTTAGPTTIPDSTSPSTQVTTHSPDKITLDPECGITKGCFPVCSGSSCSSLVTWQKNGDYILFEIAEEIASTTDNRWIAIGFSGDQEMGATSVIMCEHKTSGDSFVMGYNDGYTFKDLTVNGKSSLIKDASLTVTGNVMRCSLQRAINSTDPQVYDLNSQWYVLMGNGPIISGTPIKHEQSPKATSSKVNVQEFSKVEGGVQTSAVIKIHGCLMIIAWILFSSIGIILARHFKKHWSDSSCMKQKIWFQIHRTCMVLAVLLTLVGFILILVHTKGYRELTEIGDKSYVNYHPILGIVVFSLALLNPIIAMFRCAPDHEHRPLFNWFHSIVGTSAHIVGAITVGFGVNISKANVDSTANYILIEYAIAFVVIEFFLARLSQQPNTPDEKVFNLSASEKEKQNESGAMKFVLFLHVIAMTTSCAMLVYLVLQA
ncbi:uncharacterized protein LOC143047196 isoform X3 [Mytilus galloprovincialis]